jgi:hypothetical protein
MNLSEYSNVFCDSKKSLEWAYKHGLPKDALIRTSSPAMLWKEKANIHHVEARWNVAELKEFQNSIKFFSEDIFDAVFSLKSVEREVALAISRFSVMFQRVIYKAACLEEEDFTKPRLFIQIEGKSGPVGNNMNSPWPRLLSSNTLFATIKYTLNNDTWGVLTTQGVAYWQRYKIAGIKTLVYRLLVPIIKQLPDRIFKREVLIPNENELIIETAVSLMLKGVKVKELNIDCAVENMGSQSSVYTQELYNVASAIMKKRVEQWVTPLAVYSTMALFKEGLQKELILFDDFVQHWEKVLIKSDRLKQSVLMNTPGNIKGQTLSYVCRKKEIPFIAAQHGVTMEISKLHGEMSIGFENSVADAVLYYNSKCVEIETHSHFSKSKSYIVGMSSRHVRMKNTNIKDLSGVPIVYISTNLYRGNAGSLISWHTDYDRAKKEQEFVKKVLYKLPHKVLYKPYPEEDRRYADQDPIFNDVNKSSNITLFDRKIDMRYLISSYRIIITSGATSTLSWPVMSGKPVIFINRREKSPLTSEAHASLSKGLFVFNDNEPEFHRNLKDFLSKPIDEIETLWRNKKSDRDKMIKNYFSAYKDGNAGKRAAQVILRKYLK